MAYIDSFNINKTDYDAKYLRNTGVNEVTSLSDLPINKRMIHATLSESSTLSIQDGMEVGEGLIVICECTAEFKLQFNPDSKYKFIGEIGISQPILCQNETMFKIYITKSSDSSYVINLSRTFKEMPRDFILVSTSGGSVSLLKYTNSEGTSTESITIPASSTNYKVSGLIYGFKTNTGDAPDITSLDVSNFDTSKVTNMNMMFHSCSGLTSLDVSNWNTSNVTDMNMMFYGCSGLTSLDVSNWNTSNVTDMNSIFRSCSGLTSLDLSNFDTSSVTSMMTMFDGCSGLTSLDVSNWNTSNVTSMSDMFCGCSGLTSLDLSNFDTSNVTGMARIFDGCSRLTSLDLSNFDTSNVTIIMDMFRNCNALTHIKCKQAFKNWCWTNQIAIALPSAMKSGGGGTWEIVS